MKYFQLAELAEIINGSTPLKSNKKFWDNGTINWFTAEDLRKGDEVNSTKKFITKFALDNTSIKLVPKDSVLLCCTASIGLIGINKIELTTNQQFNAIVPDKELINFRYLFYFLKSYMSEFEKKASTTTVGFISQKKVKSILVPVPSLQEQEKIVDKLDKVFENIQNNLDMLNYLNTLITTKLEKSIFISECEKVDTKKLKVKEFSNIQGGGTPKTSVKEYWGGEIDFYTPKELSQHSDIEISRSSKKVTKLGLSKGAGKLLPVDTILFSSRAPIGYVAILKKEGSTNQGFQSFLLKNQNDKYFFYFLLRNNKEYIESYAPGATFKDISKSRIEEIEFAIPSYEQQIEIGKKMVKVKNNIEKKSKLYKSKYEELLKLRKSILNKEFSYE